MLLAQVAAWLLVGVVVVGLVSRNLTVANQPIIIAATFAPYTVVPAAFAVGLFLVAGASVGALISTALIVAVILVELWPFVTGAPGHQGPVLTVMTSNLYLGKGDPASVLKQARARGVDVIALQEITAESVAALRALGIDEDYPYRVLAPAPMWAGAALWSRLPLRDERSELVGQLYRVSAVVGLDAARTDEDPTIISLHIHAPWPPPPGDWVTQLAELDTQIQTSARPLVAMGDYNATLNHAPFRRLLRNGVTDAAATSRTWWAFTYPAFRLVPPLITIDHVVSRGMRGTNVRSVRIPGSDHLAVIVRLARITG